MAYVYRHIRLDKNDVFYVGIGSGMSGRYYRAYRKDTRNTIWKRIVAKTDYEVEIIMDGISYDEAKKKEVEFIAIYKRKENGGTLCNLTDGGDGITGAKIKRKPETVARCQATRIAKGNSSNAKGKKWSQESRNLISKLRKGRIPPNKGKKASEATILKNKLTKANRGVLQYTLDGEFVSEYYSLNDAAIAVGCTKENIWEAITKKDKSGRQKTAKGYKWEYKNQELTNTITP